MSIPGFPLSALVLMTSLLAFGAAADSHNAEREGGLTGTGIVGIVTELGSFVLNKQRVTYAPAMSVSTPFGPKPADQIRPGDVVAVQVTPRGDDWDAVEISQVFAIIGPVSAQEGETLMVMGTTVQAPASRPVTVGQWVAVTGLWREDKIVATAIAVVPPQPNASITGSYLGDAEGRIGGTNIIGLVPEHIVPGDILRATGAPEANGLVATQLDLGLFDQSVGVVLAQGYLSAPDRQGRYTVLGAGISAFTDMPSMINPMERQLYCGAQGRIITGTNPVDLRDQGVLTRLGCLP